MMNNKFWQEAAASWSWEAKPDIKVNIGSGDQSQKELLKHQMESLEDEQVVGFDDIDFDVSFASMITGGQVVMEKAEFQTCLSQIEEKQVEDAGPKIVLDIDTFDNYYEMETLTGFRNCFQLLKECGLKDELTQKSKELEKRIEVLEEAEEKFRNVYQVDLALFMENYIPEALNLVLGYIEYVNAKISDDILMSTQEEVEEALDALLIGINDKIDEIYKFASIELKATAKALNATMSANGYVDSKYKIN